VKRQEQIAEIVRKLDHRAVQGTNLHGILLRV
jgi:hypothetical protein